MLTNLPPLPQPVYSIKAVWAIIYKEAVLERVQYLELQDRVQYCVFYVFL